MTSISAKSSARSRTRSRRCNDGLKQLDFDSVDLSIHSVTVNGKDAHFSTDADKLHVDLEQPAQGRREIRSRRSATTGKPKKGLYFILPNKSNPTQPKEIWTQGEAEDTRYYLPIYDYPNDRTTTEMILTVPESWQTVSNGKLVSVTDAGPGNEDLDLAAIPAGLDVPDFAWSPANSRSNRILAQHSRGLRRAARRARPHRADVRAHARHADLFLRPLRRAVSLGQIRPDRWWTSSPNREWKTSAPRR